MANENLPDSQNDVISTPDHVLYAFESLVRDEMPAISITYSEELGFEEAVKELLAKDEYNGESVTNLMPLFAYKRTILAKSEDRHLGGRLSGKTGCTRIGDDQVQYAVTNGEFDIQFIYAANNIELTDKFEVVYNSDQGISGTKELIVDLGELGEFKYFLDYQELQDQTINFENTYYKLIIGSVKVRGLYFTFRSKSGIIKEINQRIIASRNLSIEGDDEVLGSIQCIAPEEE